MQGGKAAHSTAGEGEVVAVWEVQPWGGRLSAVCGQGDNCFNHLL